MRYLTCNLVPSVIRSLIAAAGSGTPQDEDNVWQDDDELDPAAAGEAGDLPNNELDGVCICDVCKANSEDWRSEQPPCSHDCGRNKL